MSIFNFLKPKKNLADTGLNPVMLLILDGWGIANPSAGNPIPMAKKPNFDALMAQYPHTELIASGESVGLPANEVGNTEVGHLNMGAGRTVYQDLKKISMAIEKGDFYNNKAFLEAIKHVSKNKSKLHVMGIVSTGNVHSSLNHFFAPLKLAQKYGVKSLCLHLFTDGRDAPPKEGIDIVGKIEGLLKTEGVGKIATIGGRYYAMDRDRRWDRIQKAYDAMTLGIGPNASNAVEAVQNAYANGQTDEFIIPTVITENGKPVGTIDDHDAAIFFNFRIDRPRQLTMAFVSDDFKKYASSWEFDPYAVKYQGKEGQDEKKLLLTDPFNRQKVVKDLFFVTMTEYQKGLPVSAIAFPPEIVKNGLAEVVSQAKFKQIHLAESEKTRFVTYYFNGLREEPFPGEEKVIVPSPKVPTYDKKPEMSVDELSDKIVETLASNTYKFIVANFANPDMVAHTGNLQATVRAIEAVDRALGKVVNAIKAINGTLLITADHGNAEELLNFDNSSFFFTTNKGTINTDHSNNPVPLIIVGNALVGKNITLTKGTLADIAPTILNLMGLKQPSEMTGKNLLQIQAGV